MIARVSSAPTISAGAVDGYGAIFNAGLCHFDGRYHLFARGVRSGYSRNTESGPRFLNYLSDVLVFVSNDGLHYEFDYVLGAAGSHGVHCFEDPRVQRVVSEGVEHVVMTYTNLPDPATGQPWRIGAHRLTFDGQRFHLDEQSGCLLGPAGVANKDAVVFNLRDGRIALIHRVHPDMQIAVFDTIDEMWHADDTYWEPYLASLEDHVIIRPSPDSLGVGAGAPPVVSDDGLLLFFHERRGDGVYTMRVALLDHNTGRVISLPDGSIMEPELEWERIGDMENVVFVQGSHRPGEGSIYLTYGAADSHVGAMIVDEARLLSMLADARQVSTGVL